MLLSFWTTKIFNPVNPHVIHFSIYLRTGRVPGGLVRWDAGCADEIFTEEGGDQISSEWEQRWRSSYALHMLIITSVSQWWGWSRAVGRRACGLSLHVLHFIHCESRRTRRSPYWETAYLLSLDRLLTQHWFYHFWLPFLFLWIDLHLYFLDCQGKTLCP